jgi:hypothetical protein
LDTEVEKKKTKNRMLEIDIQSKETEVDNMKNRLNKEKYEFETE